MLQIRICVNDLIQQNLDGLPHSGLFRIAHIHGAKLGLCHRFNLIMDVEIKLAQGSAFITVFDDPDDFHHRGPRPQSKETALVMLADGSEAAVRSARPGSAEEVAEIVNRIIDQRVGEAQLSECDLTLRDLEVIRETFVSVLKGVFHPRVKYPSSAMVVSSESKR